MSQADRYMGLAAPAVKKAGFHINNSNHKAARRHRFVVFYID